MMRLSQELNGKSNFSTFGVNGKRSWNSLPATVERVGSRTGVDSMCAGQVQGIGVLVVGWFVALRVWVGDFLLLAKAGSVMLKWLGLWPSCYSSKDIGEWHLHYGISRCDRMALDKNQRGSRGMGQMMPASPSQSPGSSLSTARNKQINKK
jgi:hypothetical protein